MAAEAFPNPNIRNMHHANYYYYTSHPHKYSTLISSSSSSSSRYAVVTGANKGIGFEICRQLASKGITVILTSRDIQRGLQAQQTLITQTGLAPNLLLFHHLDVLDPTTITALVDFIRTNFGKLDILVNNAGVSGVHVQGDVSILAQQIEEDATSIFATDSVSTRMYSVSAEQENPAPMTPKPPNGKMSQTLEAALQCIHTNFYGAKAVTQALIPLLSLSNSPRIVNVSSLLGNLKLLRNEWAKAALGIVEHLNEEKVDLVVGEFLNSFKEGTLKANQWPTEFSAYKVSKAALNAYTRILANKYPDFRINCLCPGFAKTDITCNLGPLTAAEAAEGPVALTLVPDGGPTGLFFYKNGKISF